MGKTQIKNCNRVTGCTEVTATGKQSGILTTFTGVALILLVVGLVWVLSKSEEKNNLSKNQDTEKLQS